MPRSWPREHALSGTQQLGVRPIDLVVALLWFIGFSIWFHSFGLPNNHVQRWMLWESIPYDFMDLIDPPDRAGSAPWSYLFLFQRIPFASIAIGIWIGAWGHGSIVLRILGIQLRGCERLFFSLCLGLSSIALAMLMLGVCGCMSRWPLMAILVAPCVIVLVIRRRHLESVDSGHDPLMEARFEGLQPTRLGWIVAIALAPFVFALFLGAMSPQNDFDVVEYHLGGPKEWFEQGQISRLPHNVYTSFPFLSEMLLLVGMVLYGDWQWGALAGQAATAGFAPLTALGLFAAARRWFSDGAGWLAVLVYLTSPWTYRISIIAYAEGGLACYLFATLYAALLFREEFAKSELQPTRQTSTIAFLAGLLSGSAMACKYTGLVSVVIPVGTLLVWVTASVTRQGRLRQTMFVGLVYSLGVIAAIGPWLLKNTVETGNPVYPLAVRIFGGKDRSKDLDIKWRHAHAAKSYKSWEDRLTDLPVKLTDVMANNDWHSPLMFGLAPLSLFWCLRRREQAPAANSKRSSQRAILGIVWLYIGWQFFTWWILTHHIDRFYVPMFSVVALAAGIGGRWWESQAINPVVNRSLAIWKWVASAMIMAAMFYNADIMLLIGGFNAGRLDLKTARDIAVTPRMKWLNEEYESGRLPTNSKILCVGEVQMFHARYPYFYNTVFDHSLFEELCADPSSQGHRLKPAAEIRAEFRRLGITHIDVNWSDILRYREPGNYGFTDFVHPDRFTELQRLGILGPPMALPASATLAPLTDNVKQQLERWAAPNLITTVAGKPAYFSGQVFPVLDH